MTADHCRKYALGQSEDCNHSHNELCEQCENAENVLIEISKLVHDSSWENKDSMLFQVWTFIKNTVITSALCTSVLQYQQVIT